MASVHDVARYLLKRRSMTAMKLQKLAYYSQAWHLAWHNEPLFDAPIEAWANGPVIRALYEVHRGKYSLGSWPVGDESKLTDSERATLDAVLDTYGRMGAQWLSDQTHREDPWKQARRDVPIGGRSSAPISPASLRQFFRSESTLGRDPERVVARAAYSAF